ncbi:MAG: aminomethyl-transferring glycine dehydrogenase subunit GcvPA [Candidatus Latescibacteria bacterium]|jgi:glycine dehydrogenase subunit 1|nr:aminomethyl-transferring glycine dehydrogenase subunit GcvPA [Candidatus Latescibacterota bacterium]
MNYTPHTGADVQHMLQTIGLDTTDDLFAPIPKSLRVKDLKVAPGMSEMEVLQAVDGLASQAAAQAPALSFLGGGAYDHFSPTVVDAMISRGEFFTAYTPYQPEVSQGTLRAIFEFQTMMCELTGMETANASMYDGSSALAEAVLMSVRMNGGSRVLLPRSLHPFYKQVIETYVKGINLELVEIPWTEAGGVDIEVLKSELTEDTAAVVIQNPNFLGVLEALDEIGDVVNASKTAFVACVNPISLGIIKPPGDFGADIVVGDGQPLGLPLAYGGPYVGFFTSRDAHLRKMPGRICGQTTDVDGKRGFVLTLQTREQHIRRDKATSNICTNQTLCATATTVYLAAVGPQGLREVGELNWNRSHQALDGLTALDGVSSKFSGSTFNEFVVEVNGKASDVLERLRQQGISAGIDLGRFYPELDNCILTCVTEKKTEADVARLVDVWRTI